MLRDIEKKKVEQGIYIRVIVRLFNKKDMETLLESIKPYKNTFYLKRIIYKEVINTKTTLLVYHAPCTYKYNIFQDFILLLKRIHLFLENSSGYLIDFISTRKSDRDFNVVGSKHYINGELTTDYYRVDDSILTTLTFYGQDGFNAADKYKYLSDFLLKF